MKTSTLFTDCFSNWLRFMAMLGGTYIKTPSSCSLANVNGWRHYLDLKKMCCIKPSLSAEKTIPTRRPFLNSLSAAKKCVRKTIFFVENHAQLNRIAEWHISI